MSFKQPICPPSEEVSEIIRILGLDSKKLIGFTLRVYVGEAATVKCAYYAGVDMDIAKETRTLCTKPEWELP